MRSFQLKWTTPSRSGSWLLTCHEFDTLEELQLLRDPSGRVKCDAFYTRHNDSRSLGAIHVSSSRSDPYDVIHEAVHAAASHARAVRRLPLNPSTEEHIASQLDILIPILLDAYGYEIRRKDPSP